MTTTTSNPSNTNEVDRWISSALKKMGRSTLTSVITWRFNSRLTSVAGRVKFVRFAPNWYVPYVIEFSPELFKNATPKQRRWVVYHEVAHVVDAFNQTYNNNAPHGDSWKALMVKAGCEPNRCHTIPRLKQARRRQGQYKK